MSPLHSVMRCLPGKISITLVSDWKEPLTEGQADADAAERALEFMLGWFANPIFVNGDYPDVMKTRIATKSANEGRNESRLPEFTQLEKTMIKGEYPKLFCLIKHNHSF